MEAKKEKETLTIYLDLDLVNELEEFIHQTRKQLPAQKKKRLNRTAIIQLVLKEIMEDQAKLKNESFLSKLISTWKDN